MKFNPHLGLPLEEFYEKNKGLIHNVVRRFSKRGYFLGVDYEDLFQHACIGFINAYERFDPTLFERVNSFSTYAVPIMEGELYKYFRDINPLVKYPRSVKDLYFLILKHGLEDESPEKIAHTLGKDIKLVKEAISYRKNLHPSRLDKPIINSDKKKLMLEETILSSDDFSQYYVNDFLSMLPEKYRIVVILRMQGKMQSEIAHEMGISQARVSCLLKKARDFYLLYLNEEGK